MKHNPFLKILALMLSLMLLAGCVAFAEEIELPIGLDGVDAPVEEVEIPLVGEEDVPMSAEAEDAPMAAAPIGFRTEGFLGKTVTELNEAIPNPVAYIGNDLYSNGFIVVAENDYGLISHIAINQVGPYAVFETSPGADFNTVNTYYTNLGFSVLSADGVTVLYGYQGGTDLAIAVTVYDGIVTDVLCAYNIPRFELGGYLGRPITELTAAIPQPLIFDCYDDYYEQYLFLNRYISVWVNPDGTISDMHLNILCPYSIFGVSFGDNFTDGLNQLFGTGFTVLNYYQHNDGELGVDLGYQGGYDLTVYTSSTDEGTAVHYISCYYVP